MGELEQIACYLNAATAKSHSGDIGWLIAGKRVQDSNKPGTANQETQCLKTDSSIWIANNDDQDSLFQKELLYILKIDTYQKLIQHVRKATLSLDLLGDGAAATRFKEWFQIAANRPANTRDVVPGNLGESVQFKLRLPGTAPSPVSLSGIVFVTGKYESLTLTEKKYHAEQKLLAAVADSLATLGRSAFYAKSIAIAGVKPACNVCKSILLDAQHAFRKEPFGIELTYSGGGGAARKDSGANRLDWPSYPTLDPSPPAAPVAPVAPAVPAVG